MTRHGIKIVFIVNLLVFGLLGYFFAADRYLEFRELPLRIERLEQQYTILTWMPSPGQEDASPDERDIPPYSEFITRLQGFGLAAEGYNLDATAFRATEASLMFSSEGLAVYSTRITAAYAGKFENLVGFIYGLECNVFIDEMEFARLNGDEWAMRLNMTMLSRG